MASFTHHYKADTATMLVVFIKGLTQDNFEGLMQFYHEQSEKDVRNWDISLSNLESVNTKELGVLVAFNAAVNNRGGKLKLMLRRGSQVTELLRLTRLDRIIDCVVT